MHAPAVTGHVTHVQHEYGQHRQRREEEDAVSGKEGRVVKTPALRGNTAPYYSGDYAAADNPHSQGKTLNIMPCLL